MLTVTRHAEFEAAHLLPDYPGACTNLHGHSYKIEVSVTCKEPACWGMTLDFKELDKIIKNVMPDHKYMYNEKDPSPVEKDLVAVLKSYGKAIQGFPFDTSAENMSGWFAEKIQEQIDAIKGHVDRGVKVTKVKLWETSNSFAEYEVK